MSKWPGNYVFDSEEFEFATTTVTCAFGMDSRYTRASTLVTAAKRTYRVCLYAYCLMVLSHVLTTLARECSRYFLSPLAAAALVLMLLVLFLLLLNSIALCFGIQFWVIISFS